MATAKINKRSVEGTASGVRDSYLWDDQLRGFGLKILPSGSRIYIVQYRLGGRAGRTRRATIGAHGTLTAEEARVRAKKLLGEVAAGQDPAEKRTQARRQLSFARAMERFLEEHVDAKLRSTTANEYRRIVSLHVPASLRSRGLLEIQRSDVSALHRKLRDKPYQSNRLLAVLSKFFNWAELEGLRPDGTNPCRHVQKYRERKRERFLSATEIENLGAALRQAERNGLATPWVIAAIRLLVLTGARLSEIRTLLWSEVDLSRRILRLSESKTGEKTIHLSAAAVAIMTSIPRRDDNPFVICGEKRGACLVNIQKPWRRIRAAAHLDEVRIHDLRHSFASVAAAQGCSLQMIGALLGHSQPSTTARYAHLADRAVAETSDELSAIISKWLFSQ